MHLDGGRVAKIKELPDKHLGQEKQEQPKQSNTDSAENIPLVTHQDPETNPPAKKKTSAKNKIRTFFGNIRDLLSGYKCKQLVTDPRVWLELVALVVLAFYTNYTRLTLNEIRSGSSDTHALAVAAGRQAAASSVQSMQAIEQTNKMAESLLKTDSLIKEANKQAIATRVIAAQGKISTEAARSISETTSNQLVDFKNSQRAIMQPLISWDDDTHTISYSVKNAGMTPAIDIVANVSSALRPCGSPVRKADIVSHTHSSSLGSLLAAGGITTPEKIASGMEKEGDRVRTTQRCNVYTIVVAYKDVFGREQTGFDCKEFLAMPNIHACNIPPENQSTNH